jgi:hypothetical protein
MEVNKPLKKQNLIVLVSVFFTACGQGDFNYGKVNNIIQGTPMHLDAEYVMLSQGQVDCGVENELWDTPEDSAGHKIAHLTQKGRDLKFADDVSIGDMNRPYVQIRGDFNLVANEITSDKAGPDPNTKLVQTKVGVNIQNSCFGDPLPLMGVRKGNFTQDASPVLLFRYDNGWQMDRFVH